MTKIIVLLALTILFLFVDILVKLLKDTNTSGYLLIKEDEDGEKYLYLFLEIDKDREQSIFNHDIVKLKVVKK